MPEIVDFLIAHAIASCRDLTASEEPPVNPFRLAKALGAEVMERDLPSGEAMVLRTGRDIAIIVEPGLFARPASRVRLRFTLAHELAHILIDNAGAAFPRGRPYVDLEQREKVCDLLASNILVPRDWLVRLLVEIQKSPEPWTDGCWVQAPTVIALRKRFQVSLDAIINAIREVSPVTTAVKFECTDRRSEADLAGGKGRMRVSWSSATTQKGNAIFRGQSLALDSPLGIAATNREPFVGECELSLRPLPRKVYPVSGTPMGSTQIPGLNYLITVCVES